MIECLKDGIISFSKNDFDIFIDMFNKSIQEITGSNINMNNLKLSQIEGNFVVE